MGRWRCVRRRIPRRSRSSARRALRLLPIAAVLLGTASGLAPAADDLKKTGTVSIEQVQLAWIGSGNLGGGKLQFGGRTHEFTIGGLGIGGFGISRITATGEVYNLNNIGQFPGAYIQGRYGFAVGTASEGELWLKNPNGVVLRLKAERTGLALSLGGDAIYINLD
jgi:hypothetical protein